MHTRTHTHTHLPQVCIIEWGERMPASVMGLPRKLTLQVDISGVGAQAAGVWGCAVGHLLLRLVDSRLHPSSTIATVGGLRLHGVQSAQTCQSRSQHSCC